MKEFFKMYPLSPYGAMISAALILWLFVSLKSAKPLKKQKSAKLTHSALIALFAFSVPVGFVFSRLLWCVSNYQDYLMNPASIYKVWEGGLSLWGFILGFWLTSILYSKHIGVSGAYALDAFAVGLPLFICILRLSEVFTGQGVGRIITYDFLINPVFTVYDIHGEARFSVYRLESVYALILFIVMCVRFKKYPRKNTNARGDLWRYAVGAYAMAQIVFESMREDDYMRFGFVRVSQALAILILLIFAFFYVARLKKSGLLKLHFLWMIPLTLIGAALTIYQEFMVDAALHTEKEHLIMFLGAFLLFAPSLFSIKKISKRKKKAR